MKKILLALLTLISVISYSQTTGYLRYDSVRIMKAGANSNLIIENATRDSLGFLYNYGNGRTRFEVIRAVAGGIKVGEDTIIISGANQEGLIYGGSVTPEGGFRFSVQESIYSIAGVIYTEDSLTAIVDSADATYDRFDVFYLDETGFHILEGIPAENPTIPQLQGGQILLTVVSIEAGAIQANITTINVYFENDATITPSGTTAVGNATTAPYAGTYHIRITTINNGDYVDIIKTSGTWDISGVDFLSLHIKNLAQILQLQNLRISLWNGASTGSQVSGEIILNYNKNNITTYQAISIPMAAFGNITNTNIDRIRLRFTSNNANTTTGFDLDNIFFGDNMQQPGNGGTGQFTLNVPSFLTLTPSNTILTNNTTYTLAANGTTAQVVRGDGSLGTDDAVNSVGAFGSQASSVNGLVISAKNIYGQPVTATEPGMVTPAMKTSWDSSYYAVNLGNGLQILRQVDAATTGFRSLIFIGADTSASNDSVLVADFSGGGSSGRFGVSGEDDAATQNRLINGSNTHTFLLQDWNSVGFTTSQNSPDETESYSQANQHIILNTQAFGFYGIVDVAPAVILLQNDLGVYKFTNLLDSASGSTKMVIWDSATNKLFATAIPTGGGATPDLQAVTDEGSVTTNTITANAFDLSTGEVVTTAGELVVRAKAGKDLNLGADGTAKWFINTDGELGEAVNGDLGAYSFQSTSGTSRFQDMVLTYETAPGTPAAGLGALYTKTSDKKLYWKDDAGVEYDLTGGGGDNIYTADGTLAGNRIVDLDGNTLSVNQGANSFLSIDPTAGGEQVILRAYNITDDDNQSILTFATQNTKAEFELKADFNSGVKTAEIEAEADVSASSITHTADIHTLNGAVGIVGDLTLTGDILTATDNTYDIGSAAASFQDAYLRILHLDGATSGGVSIFSDALGNTINSTVLTGTGAIPVVYDVKTRADETLVNTTSDQDLFTNAAHNTFAIQANTTYEFEARFDLTHGSTAHTFGFGMTPTTATISSIEYNTNTWVTAVGTASNTQNSNRIKVTTVTTIYPSGANAVHTVEIKGSFTVGATGGFITPQIKFGVDPTGTILLKTGATFKIWATGNNTYTEVSPWQ